MDFASPRSNYSAVSQLNVSRLMKLHDPAAQIDIQSVLINGDLNDVRMVNLVRHRFIIRRPRHVTPLTTLSHKDSRIAHAGTVVCAACHRMQGRLLGFAAMPPLLVCHVKHLLLCATITRGQRGQRSITRGHPRVRVPTFTTAAGWRKPVWRTGGPKRPSLGVLPPETDEQNSTPRGSLLAVMTANREQFNQRP
jgi:hypothetical protein